MHPIKNGFEVIAWMKKSTTEIATFSSCYLLKPHHHQDTFSISLLRQTWFLTIFLTKSLWSTFQGSWNNGECPVKAISKQQSGPELGPLGHWFILCTNPGLTEISVLSCGPLTTRRTSRPWSVSREVLQSCEGYGTHVWWGAAEGTAMVWRRLRKDLIVLYTARKEVVTRWELVSAPR